MATENEVLDAPAQQALDRARKTFEAIVRTEE
jgi:flavin-binding protein dodecin